MQNTPDPNAGPFTAGPPAIQTRTPPPFLLQGPMGTFYAKGISRVVSRQSIEVLQRECSTLLGALAAPGSEAPVLVGALPFDRTAACWLYQPQTLHGDADAAIRALGQPHQSPAMAGTPAQSVRLEPDRKRYQEMVREAASLLSEHPQDARLLRKVVLARSLVVERSGGFDLARLLRRLLGDASVTTYCLPLPATAETNPCLLGATPELLISRRGHNIESRPLAGSIPRQADTQQDRHVAEQLLGSAKDRAEHQVVVEFIADQLSPLCMELHVPAVPSLCATRSMWHLGTHIQGRLRHPEDTDTSSSLALAARLQPTPALCGDPRDQAQALIRRLEPVERGYYGGTVGWSDSCGIGDWYVAIRCAEIQGGHARLFAGAGIMHNSDPLAEADETAAKFQAMAHALELGNTFQ